MRCFVPRWPVATLVSLVATAGVANAGEWTGAYISGIVGRSLEGQGASPFVGSDQNPLWPGNTGTFSGSGNFVPGSCGRSTAQPSFADGCAGPRKTTGFGGRGGYDWRSGSFVVGAVGDVSVFNRGDLKRLGAVRVRTGVAAGRGLFYVTGGGASGKLNESMVFGYQLGAGVEYRTAPNVSFGLEFLRTRLDDAGAARSLTAPRVPEAQELRSNAVRASVSYRF